MIRFETVRILKKFLEDRNNKITSLSSSSTNTQYPSAKAVYDFVQNKVNKTNGTSQITDTNANNYTNIGNLSSGATQQDINNAINNMLGTVQGLEVIKVVSDKGEASASTMNKLYIVSENNKVNVYYTKQNGNNYSWAKLDEDILDELNISWSDIQNKPSTYPPSEHTHSNYNKTTYNQTLSQNTDGAYEIGKINIDGINTTIFGKDTDTKYTPSNLIPLVDSINGTKGTSANYSREDHAHPHIKASIISTSTSQISLDDYKEPGIYKINGVSTLDVDNSIDLSSYSYAILEIKNYSTTSLIQILYTIKKNVINKIFYRICYTDVWTNWSELTKDTIYTHPSYTARTGKPTANQTPAFGDTITISQIISDNTGHITAATDRTIKIPNALGNGTKAGLSTCDFTNVYKNKVNNLKNVALSGSYTDLSDTPELSYENGVLKFE